MLPLEAPPDNSGVRVNPPAAAPTPRTGGTAQTPYQIAVDYIQAGLSVVPIRRDATKAPAIASWAWLQGELPTSGDLSGWYETERPPGIGIIWGAVSGGLELIDFDREAEVNFPAWCDLVEAERPGLVGRLCVVRTPRPGFHVRYRCTRRRSRATRSSQSTRRRRRTIGA
jgi:hypothetical protein